MSHIRLMLNNLELWHRSYQLFYQLQIDYNIDTWRGTGTTACLQTEEVSLQSHKSVSGLLIITSSKFRLNKFCSAVRAVVQKCNCPWQLSEQQ